MAVTQRFLTHAALLLAEMDVKRDHLLATYPRSGNTWMRAVLSDLLRPDGIVRFEDCEMGVTDIHKPHLPTILRQKIRLAPPRIAVKTHSLALSNLSYRSVLVVVRDPRDVIPSYHRLNTGAGTTRLDLRAFASAAIMGAVWPGTWYDHLRSWQYVAQLRPGSISFVRYRDLTAHDPAAIATVARRFDLPTERLSESMKKLDLAAMRRIEAQTHRNGPATAPNATPFVGQGATQQDDRAVVEDLIRRHAPHWFELIEAVC